MVDREQIQAELEEKVAVGEERISELKTQLADAGEDTDVEASSALEEAEHSYPCGDIGLSARCRPGQD